ncbi:MAG: FAD-dependent oxidoreductase, partial [Thermomicrobiaceae bacterium]|nr:FAD-dependent oxidoreductase [Thermomicrobiaceae bacterium]
CGYPRVSAARLRLESGEEVTVRADGLVYAVGLLPNTHWLRGSGVEVGPDGAIVVDEGYRASVPGIYAVGTVVAPSLDHERSIAMGEEVAATLREDGAR